MLEWLDQNVGANLATYIGVLLGVIGIFFGGYKLNKQKSVNIKGGNNAINIQSGRDITVHKVSKK
ncbi:MULTISPECIES: hypothetical protein [Plesiomonas]|uniref:hypothetical protein n=1 Tax=Plesiomonas TaxID=702 RepID=UPI001F1B2DCA|nr:MULTISPECIES: hypothetical protein [Plesiomonas]MCE5163743.1 hypothetical protein [Plesiomonas sp. PI-19]MCQ8859932.1 hypothetical protein [Plesiomonas shigelloides]MCX9457572.1 hypothetical protein [Vibrio cholerae]